VVQAQDQQETLDTHDTHRHDWTYLMLSMLVQIGAPSVDLWAGHARDVKGTPVATAGRPVHLRTEKEEQ
jgi:hypothetical protein